MPNRITYKTKERDESGRDALRFTQINKITSLHKQITENVRRRLSVLVARGPGLPRRLYEMLTSVSIIDILRKWDTKQTGRTRNRQAPVMVEKSASFPAKR